MTSSKTTTQAALAAALLALGVTACGAPADSAAGESAPTAQSQHAEVLDVAKLRTVATTLLADMKSDPTLATQFEQDPHSVLGARGVPAFVQEDVANEIYPKMDCGHTCMNTCEETCAITCTVTSAKMM